VQLVDVVGIRGHSEGSPQSVGGSQTLGPLWVDRGAGLDGDGHDPLEALAGFYDRDGALLGTARDVYHLDESTEDPTHEGVPDEAHPFRIRVPADLQGRAVSAAVGIPVLVNE
jgi:hypothetical protein